jgi:hypothetical protein
MLAVEMMLAEEDVKSDRAKTSSLKRTETQTTARPLRRNKTDPDDKLLRGSSNGKRSATFLYSQILQKLENVFLSEEDDPSYQSESTLSEVEEGGTIVEKFTDNDDRPLHRASFPIFIEGQKGARSDVTGASSTADVFQTINKADSAIEEDIIEVSDSTRACTGGHSLPDY